MSKCWSRQNGYGEGAVRERYSSLSVGVMELAGGPKLAVPGALVKPADRLAGAQGQAAGGQPHGVLRGVVKLAALPKPAVPRLLEEVADGLAGALREERRQAAALVAYNAHCRVHQAIGHKSHTILWHEESDTHRAGGCKQ